MKKCKDQQKTFVSCKYNAGHQLPRHLIDTHHKECPDGRRHVLEMMELNQGKGSKSAPTQVRPQFVPESEMHEDTWSSSGGPSYDIRNKLNFDEVMKNDDNFLKPIDSHLLYGMSKAQKLKFYERRMELSRQRNCAKSNVTGYKNVSYDANPKKEPSMSVIKEEQNQMVNSKTIPRNDKVEKPIVDDGLDWGTAADRSPAWQSRGSSNQAYGDDFPALGDAGGRPSKQARTVVTKLEQESPPPPSRTRPNASSPLSQSLAAASITGSGDVSRQKPVGFGRGVRPLK